MYQEKKKLHVVIPFVFYHGKESWKLATEFERLFEKTDTDLMRYIPQFSYAFFEAPRNDALLGSYDLAIQSILYTARHIWDEDAYRMIASFLELYSAELYIGEYKKILLEILLRYMCYTKELSRADIENLRPKDKGGG